MSKVLGLDLGDKSIGWSIIDTTTSSIMHYGVRVLHKANQKNKRKSIITLSLQYLTKKSMWIKHYILLKPFLISITLINLLALILTIVDTKNWQLWFNIFLSTLLTLLTIFHYERNDITK